MRKNKIKVGATVAVIKHLAPLFIACVFFSGTALCKEVLPASPWITGTYSNFSYNKEAGDLNGVEIRLIRTRTGIKGVIQFAEGGAGDVALVNVIAEGTRLRFELPSGFQQEGVFEGLVSKQGIDGTFFYEGGAHKHLALPRTPSYWDRH
ncbi:MAG: hypothetical protein ACI8WM_003391 [Burkholderiaceae bacterium]|jgi:hypothetical protein